VQLSDLHAVVALYPPPRGKEPRYPLHTRLGGAQIGLESVVEATCIFWYIRVILLLRSDCTSSTVFFYECDNLSSLVLEYFINFEH